jgi:pescadillo protein
MKTHLKKVKKLRGRGLADRAKELKQNAPKYSLDYLVKERYPTFQDALKDLDDPLCLINLFAAFPSHKLFSIPRQRIETCIRLSREFNLFVIRTQALRKAFFSNKGVYFQAEIRGQPVTWVVPYPLTHELPSDVDYRIMLTFLEFYETLIRFVNYKLYAGIGLNYPPGVDQTVERAQYYTYSAFQLQAKQLNPEEEYTHQKYDTQSGAEFVDKDKGVMKQEVNKNLFDGLTFYLSRETPRLILEFVVLAFGGKVLNDDENGYVDLKDPSITHIITDREPQHLTKIRGK